MHADTIQENNLTHTK